MISNETWVESSRGAYYIVVPVCEPADGAGSPGKVPKTSRDASPRSRGSPDIDMRTLETALHPTAADDGATAQEEVHKEVTPPLPPPVSAGGIQLVEYS